MHTHAYTHMWEHIIALHNFSRRFKTFSPLYSSRLQELLGMCPSTQKGNRLFLNTNFYSHLLWSFQSTTVSKYWSYPQVKDMIFLKENKFNGQISLMSPFNNMGSNHHTLSTLECTIFHIFYHTWNWHVSYINGILQFKLATFLLFLSGRHTTGKEIMVHLRIDGFLNMMKCLLRKEPKILGVRWTPKTAPCIPQKVHLC